MIALGIPNRAFSRQKKALRALCRRCKQDAARRSLGASVRLAARRRRARRQQEAAHQGREEQAEQRCHGRIPVAAIARRARRRASIGGL